MRGLCQLIEDQVMPNFANLETALRTYDRDAPVCGAPAWRYAYHTIHSADKWFINPDDYSEPDFHQPGMDDPDAPCTTVLSDEELLEYLGKVREKTVTYLRSITDEMLGEKPEKCRFTRLELILGQFRHISFHTGMLNGQTIERTGKFPVFVGTDPESFDKLKGGLYE